MPSVCICPFMQEAQSWSQGPFAIALIFLVPPLLPSSLKESAGPAPLSHAHKTSYPAMACDLHDLSPAGQQAGTPQPSRCHLLTPHSLRITSC